MQTSPTQAHEDARNKLFDLLEKETKWELFLFIPSNIKRTNKQRAKFDKHPFIKIYQFNTTPIEGFKWFRNFTYKLKLGTPRPHNVLIPSILLSLLIGYKKIFLYGADHSWHEGIKVDELSQATVNHEHFYDKGEDRMAMYKLDGKEYYIHDIFRKLHLAFKGYFLLKEFAESVNAEIFNASERSYIDAFEKINLNSE